MKALHHTTNRHSRAHAKSGRTAALVLAALTGSACDAVLHPAVQNTHNSYGDEEHIVIPEDIADAANVLPNDTPNLPGYHRAQILVSIDAADNPSSNVDEMALFTVSGVFDAGNAQQIDAFVWDDDNAPLDGKRRLELGPGTLNGQPLDVHLDEAVAQDWDEPCPAQDPSYGLVECLDGDIEQVFSVVDNYVFLAPHGGNIEPHTDEQAQAASTHSFAYQNGTFDMADHSLAWFLKGFRSGGGAHKHFHIASEDIGRGSFPKLDLIGPKVDNLFNGFPYAVAFHGMSNKPAKYTIYVGGGSSLCVRNQVVATLTAVLANESSVSVVLSPDPKLDGTSALNLVNWLTLNGAGGIQLEQTSAVREDYGTAVAHAVAELLPQLDGLCP
ncbi:MAG: poly-gamma-glutamate hydrolase family protein [Myxococcales bacterium]|nr:poly-gamma-glutamate hydrolase family protein [Myxococcales bacterium]